MICPNVNDPSWKEQVDALGEDLAYFTWDANGGYPLSETKTGEPSTFFQELLDNVNGHRAKAMKLKAQTLSKTFPTVTLNEQNEPTLYREGDTIGVLRPGTNPYLPLEAIEQAEEMTPVFSPEGTENADDFERKLAMMQKTFAPHNISVEFGELAQTVNAQVKNDNGKVTITINSKKGLGQKDTLLHEYAHIYIDLLGGLTNQQLAFGLKQLEGTKLEAEVKAAYPDLDQDTLNKEILATAIGREAADIFENEQAKKTFSSWLNVLFNRIKAALGLQRNVAKSLAQEMLNDQLQKDAMTGSVSDTAQEQRERMMNTPFDVETDLEAIVRKVKERMLILQKKYKSTKNETFKREINKLVTELEHHNDVAALFRYVRRADAQTDAILEKFEHIQEVGADALDVEGFAELLRNYKVYAGAYNLTGEIQTLLTQNGVKKPIIDKKLTEIEAKLKKINDIYVPVVQKYIVDNYALKSSFMKNEYTKQFAKEFQELNPRREGINTIGKEAWNKQRDEFVAQRLEDNKDIIDNAQKEYVERILNTTRGMTKDIDGVSAWIVDPKNLNDTMISIGTTILDEADFKVNQEFIEELRVANQLFEEYKKGRDVSNQKELYKPYLEKLGGDVSANLIGKYLSNVQDLKRQKWADYNKVADEYGETSLEAAKAKKELNDWLDANSEREYVAEFYELADELRRDYGDEYNRLAHEKSILLKPYRTDLGLSWSSVPTSIRKRVAAIENKQAQERKKLPKKSKEEVQAFKALYEEVPSEQYKIEYYELYKAAEDGGPKAQAAFDTWYKANHNQKGQPHKKWMNLTPRNPEQWANPNYREGKFTPNSKWLNPQWQAIEEKRKANPEDIEVRMYDYLKETYRKKDEQSQGRGTLGHGFSDNALEDTYSLPAIERGTIERVLETGMFTAVKEFGKDVIKRRSEDTEFGEEESPEDQKNTMTISGLKEILIDEERKQKQYVPLYYRGTLANAEDQSYDLMSITMMDLFNTLNYEAKSGISSDLEMLRDMMGERQLLKRTGAGEWIVNGIMGKDRSPVYVDGSKSNSYLVFSSILEDRLYGMSSIDAGYLTIPGTDKKIHLNTVSNSVAAMTGSIMLTFNYLSAGAALTQGKVMNFLEGVGKEDFTHKDLMAAEKLYWSKISENFADTGKRINTGMTNLFLEKFDVLGHGRGLGTKFSDNNIAKMLAAKGLQSLNLNNIQEHYTQSMIMYAVLNSTTVKDVDGNTIKLSEAYERDPKGVLKPKPGVLIPDGLEFKIQRKIKEIVKQAHGNYQGDNKAMFQRLILGQHVFMLRKWLVPGTQKRWRGFTTAFKKAEDLKEYDRFYNEILERETEGTYVTALRQLIRVRKELATLKFKVLTAEWDKLTDWERANIRRTTAELSFVAITFAAAALMKGLADDEDEKWMYYPAFFLRRAYSELFFYLNPVEAFRITRSPMATVSMVERSMRLLGQAIGDGTSIMFGGEAERYLVGDRKGDLKLGRKTRQLFPIFSQLERDIKEATEFLESETNN